MASNWLVPGVETVEVYHVKKETHGQPKTAASLHAHIK